MKCAKWIDRYYPTSYASDLMKSPKTCGVIYHKYVHVNHPGAFRPHLMPSGLWVYKNSYPSKKITKPLCDSLMLPAGGETEIVYNASADFVLDKNPFDSGATCRIFKGSLKRNGVSFDVAGKKYQVKTTYKYKHQLEKEVKCMMRLKYSNVLRHFGLGFDRSILVTEFLWKGIKLGGGQIECVHNARQLLDTLEDDIPWAHRLNIVHKACLGLKYLHENGIVHCDAKACNIFIRGGSESEYSIVQK